MMFTDIVGSTARAGELGDARWRALLDRHDELVRDHAEAAGGRVVKTTGDGSLCVFDGPARAIRCSQEVAGAVGDLGVEVRVDCIRASVKPSTTTLLVSQCILPRGYARPLARRSDGL